MAVKLQNIPSVRRQEINLSTVLNPQNGATVGTVIRSYKGRTKRPILVTSPSDFVSEFGAPVFTSGFAGGTYTADQRTITVPDFGYGSYGVLYALEETSSVVVVRSVDNATDKYATTTVTTSAATATSATSANFGSGYTGSSTAVDATSYTPGSQFDTDTYISDIDGSTAPTGTQIKFAHLAPSKFGNSIAVTIERPWVATTSAGTSAGAITSACDWLYTYDGFKDLGLTTSGDTTTSAWSNATERNKNFPIASQVVKISVFVKPETSEWDKLYTTSSDTSSGLLRITPVETFYCAVSDIVDSQKNSLFVEDVINGSSKYIYVKAPRSTTLDTIYAVPTSASAYYKTPTGTDENGTYVRYSSLATLGGGAVGNGISTNSNDWSIFQNRTAVDVDVLLGTEVASTAGGMSTAKFKVTKVAAYRKDCFANVQSHNPSKYKAQDIKTAELYGYSAPSYVGLAAGYSTVYDSYNSKNVWLPNVIFMTQVDLRRLTAGVPWEAPAGTDVGIVSVNEQFYRFTEPEMDMLSGSNINYLAYKRGYGFVVWGQRTANLKAEATNRKNVRYNLLYIQKNIENMLNQFIFTTNTAQTRNRAASLGDTFLGGVKAKGGLYDYMLVCDESNNPASIIDNNEMNYDVYVKPTKTDEYINFNTIIARTGDSFDTVRLGYV